MIKRLKMYWLIAKFIFTQDIYFIYISDFDNMEFASMAKGLSNADADFLSNKYSDILAKNAGLTKDD